MAEGLTELWSLPNTSSKVQRLWYGCQIRCDCTGKVFPP